MIKNIIASSLVLLAITLPPQSSFGAEKLYLNTGIRDPFTTTDQTGFINLIIKEAFSRVGIDAEVIVYQDSAKSLGNANSGIDDGAALRVEGLEKKFPNLIRVPEKLMDNDFVAYSVDPSIKVDGWESLNGLSVAFVRGWQIFLANTKGHKSLTLTKSAQEMLDLLADEHVQVILYERWQGLWRANQLGLNLITHEPPLASKEMFVYLNEKHRDIVGDVAKALADMKKDGTYENIFDQTLAQYQK